MSATYQDKPEELLLAVENAVNEFSTIQQRHGQILADGKLDNIPRMFDQRERAIARLKQSLTNVWQCEMLQRDMLIGDELQLKIGKLLQQEKDLARLTESRRDTVQKQISQIRKGKKAMAGYGKRPNGPTYFHNAL